MPLQWVHKATALRCDCTPRPILMQTDYTAAIAGLTALVIVLTGMTVFVLSRPSDLAPRSPR
jgi:hypothetical protein